MTTVKGRAALRIGDAQLERDIQQYCDEHKFQYMKHGNTALFSLFTFYDPEDRSEILMQFAERILYHSSRIINTRNFSLSKTPRRSRTAN